MSKLPDRSPSDALLPILLAQPPLTAEAPMDSDGRVLPEVLSESKVKRYKLVEIFESVKGEGTQAGIPMVFVRFSKCNLTCAWCDTPYNRVAIELGRDELIRNLLERQPRWVIFTGGEPCLQLDEELVIPLRERGVKCAIETNGMLWTPALKRLDYINVSPKLGKPMSPALCAAVAHGTVRLSELRYTICDGQTDLWNAATGEYSATSATAQELTGTSPIEITISPAMKDPALPSNFKSGEGFRSMYGEVDQGSLNRCLYLVNKYRHLRARLSVQVHRFIGAR